MSSPLRTSCETSIIRFVKSRNGTDKCERMESPNPTSVYALEPGVVYVVIKPLVDYHKGEFKIGELLTYQGHSFLPYHGGYTIFFREKAMYLQENDHAEILFGMSEYLAVHDASGRHLLPVLREKLKPAIEAADLLLSLGMFTASLAVLFIERGRGFMPWACTLFFAATTVFSGLWWWESRRK